MTIDPTFGVIVGAICLAIPPTLLAYATLRQSRINGAKAEVQTVEIGAVKELANGNFRRLQEQLAAANSEIQQLHATIMQLVKLASAKELQAEKDTNGQHAKEG